MYCSNARLTAHNYDVIINGADGGSTPREALPIDNDPGPVSCKSESTDKET